MEFYNLTIEGVSPTKGHKLIIFGDLKESLFAATKTLVDEELKELTNLSTDRYEAEYIEKSIEFQNSILPIVEQLYKNGFFDEVLNPTIDTESIYEYTNVDYEDRRYSVLLENTDSAVRGKYLNAKMYEERIDLIVEKIAQVHKKVGISDFQTVMKRC